DNNVLGLTFSPNGRILASCSDDIEFWDPETGKQIRRFGSSENRIMSVAFSPDGKTLASGEVFGSAISLWSVATGKEVRQIAGIEWAHVAFSPDGKTLAGGGGRPFKPGELVLWEVGSGKELRRFSGHANQVHAVAFSPSGRLLASGDYDGVIR